MMTPKVVIVVEGGVVQDVLCDQHIQVLLIDYDTDGMEEPEMVPVPVEGTKTESDAAYVVDLPMHRRAKRVEQLFRLGRSR